MGPMYQLGLGFSNKKLDFEGLNTEVYFSLISSNSEAGSPRVKDMLVLGSAAPKLIHCIQFQVSRRQ